MQPDPSRLLRIAGIRTPLIALYDAPDPSAFEPLAAPKPGARACIFSFYDDWIGGAMLRITKARSGCGGAGRAFCGVETRSREAHVEFLVDDEGLKASRELMRESLEANPPYRQRHPDLFIGPLRPPLYEHGRSSFHKPFLKRLVLAREA